jgi:methionyl-tRNA formyltransferase
MNTVFFGASRFVLPLIITLQAHYKLTLVVTTETGPLDAVGSYCEKQKMPLIRLKQFDKHSLEQIRMQRSEFGVLAYFGIILPIEVLNLFPKGIINIHPSLLPQYRGPTPVQSAILNADMQTGVSVIRLDSLIDHGPLLDSQAEPIAPQDTTVSLYERLFTKAASMLETVVPPYIHGRLIPQPQNEKNATYSKRSLTRRDGFINPADPPSKEYIDRMIRAYYPWPGAWTVLPLNGKDIRVKLLPGKLLQAQGKKPIPVRDFINGYPHSEKMIENLLSAE